MLVTPIGEGKTSGTINLWNEPRFFGVPILPLPERTKRWGFLSREEGTAVSGFLATELADPDSDAPEVEVEWKGNQYPFIARRKKGDFEGVFVGSGVGGWGNRWHGNDWEGYTKMWTEVIYLAV